MAIQRTALIVDDVAYARKILREMLLSHGYSVIAEASNGREAMTMSKQYKPDFIIMDMVMPDVGGIEATRKILEDNKESRIIMVSSVVHEQFLMEAINSGARDFIAKPFSADDLITSIEKAFEDSVSDTMYSGKSSSGKLAAGMK